MKKLIFATPGNEKLAASLSSLSGIRTGKSTIRSFPDGETYVRIHDDLKDSELIIVCTLDHPNIKILPLYFLCKTARDLGARSILLVVPYLAYLRQDEVFNPGEGMTSRYFGKLISDMADGIITVDPHLHRYHHLNQIYSIPGCVIHAADKIAEWIDLNVNNPVLIGPDSESAQWVKKVAEKAEIQFIVLQKIRTGDRKVQISIPGGKLDSALTPVIVDDIISTGHTMIETARLLSSYNTNLPICIGVHPVLDDISYNKMLESGIKKVVSCNTIPHKSNGINLDELYIPYIRQFNDLSFD